MKDFETPFYVTLAVLILVSLVAVYSIANVKALDKKAHAYERFDCEQASDWLLYN